MITYRFDIKKAIQVINYLLKKNGGTMNYTKLLKLLYIADKRILERSCFSITTDSYASIKNGPVTSTIYDLIKGNRHVARDIWDTLFVKDGYALKLLSENNLPENLLSRAEIETLDSVFEEFKGMTYNELIEYTHRKDLFPEVRWEDAEKHNTSYPLPVEDILASIGYKKEEISIIDAEVTSQEADATFFSSCY